jgi:hypothetical protein
MSRHARIPRLPALHAANATSCRWFRTDFSAKQDHPERFGVGDV